MKDKKTLGVISLGCDKNRVDSEKLLALCGDKYVITSDISQAQIIVVNTCAFLQSARKEAIETIIECDGYRKSGRLEKLIVTGCLPQRFISELYQPLTEVDGFLGTFDYNLFDQLVTRLYEGERVELVGKGCCSDPGERRMLTTPLHYAYLKIADGCDNKCTYCLIPSIRGKYCSQSIERLVSEAAELGELSELILVAQDVTRYGVDLYGKKMLVPLIRELSRLDNVESIRLLYCYPELIDNELIDELINNKKLIKYLDIPLQHASSRVLKRMNRKGTYESYLQLVKDLRQRVEGIALRTTFISGFPGESEEDFAVLKQFIELSRFENAGFFAYSREEGTPAFRLDGHMPASVKKQRVKELYRIQKDISKQQLAKYKGQTVEVLCDGIDYDKGCFVGRAYFQAPEIDGNVYFTASEDVVVNQGERYAVKITKTNSYDLYGRIK